MPARRLLIMMVATLWLWPVPARAEWYVSPFVGGYFGGAVTEAPKVSFGGSIGWTGAHAVGVEVEAAGYPDFFGSTDIPKVLFASNYVSTMMVNGVASLPWQRFGVRPYASGGIGLVRSRIGENDDFIRGKNNNFGFNVGGGATGYFSDHVGVRADVRYFRAVQSMEGSSEFFSFDSIKVDFWRGTGGVVFRF